MGAWIEIIVLYDKMYMNEVAPLVGAWIEIPLPKRKVEENEVAPLVGAWIEIVHGIVVSDPH